MLLPNSLSTPQPHIKVCMVTENSKLRKKRTDILEIGYFDSGQNGAPPIFFIHGWPDDARGWSKVTPELNAAGFRTIAPFLRGFGPTRFLSSKSVRDGSGFALAQDVVDLADALGISTFSVVGHDWGARAAYILAALFPDRVKSIATISLPFQPGMVFRIPSFSQARLFWYQWFMCTEGGAYAVEKDPIGFAKIQWNTWGPSGWYEEEEFTKTSRSFKNVDWASITLHGYRSRFLPAKNDSRYQGLRLRMSKTLKLDTPTVLIMGEQDICDIPSSTDEMCKHFKGPYKRIIIPGSGHFPPREAHEIVSSTLIAHFKKHDVSSFSAKNEGRK
jgi:pimeloyl-ACP methyl ester carboxylesterase